MDKQAVEQLRLQLLENGYTPLPNVDKRCMMKGWPSMHVDADRVREWTRIHGLAATGLRVENGLCMPDFDIPCQKLMDATADAVFEAIPALADPSTPLLVRHGKGAKEAWAVRCDELFGRIGSYKFIEPGKTAEDGMVAALEIFNGGSARQFGAFGPHTRPQDAADGVGIDYRWEDLSPADIALADLPVLAKADCFRMIEIFEATARALGWQQVTQSESGENVESRVYDLTDDMVFQCNDDVDRTLDELREWAKVEDGGRCSASWLEGSSAKRRDRCLVSLTRAGFVAVYETASGVTHIETAGEPVPEPGADLNLDRLAELLQELQDRRRNRINAGDDFNSSLVKALASYAWCPGMGLVLPLWPHSALEGETIGAFRIRLMKHGYREVGPNGGRGHFVNPADAWAAHEQLIIVDGVQMRPDQPRPTFEEDGRRYVNCYRPKVFLPDVAAKGSAEPGFDFLRRLVPEEDQRETVVKWLAYKLRNPHVPMYALVMVAHETFGTGRNTLGDLMALLLGEAYVKEVPFETFTGKTYQSQYNEWQADSLLVVVSESAEADGSTWQTKRNTYERLKLIVDPRPGRRVLVNVKTRGNYYTLTSTSFLIATNHADALPIPEHDRRFCVIQNGDAQPQEYWAALRRWMAVPENVAAFGRALMDVDLSAFNPFDPPLYEGKRIMAEESRSDLDRAFQIAVESMPGEVMMIEQVKSVVERVFQTHDLDRPNVPFDKTIRNMVRRSLHAVGVRHGKNFYIKVDGKRHQTYARTVQHAKKWTDADQQMLHREAMKNGRPGGSVIVLPFAKP